MGLKGCVADTEAFTLLLVFSERLTGHSGVQTLTSLNVFEITWTVGSRKCNQLLKLNFGSVEKYPLQISLKNCKQVS